MQQTAQTLVDLLRWRALHQPNQHGYTFLIDGEAEEIHLTYKELDQRAQIIGALLQDMAAPGARALLLYPPGIDYITAFFGCLYAGIIAVPTYAPHPARLQRDLPRLRAIVQDAQPAIALATTGTLTTITQGLVSAPEFQQLRWIATDDPRAATSGAWSTPAIDSSSLAFLQYTSGSTTTPKGVMVTHGNLLHNSALIHHGFAHSSESRGVIWLPPYHDMGLIGGILQPLYGGFPVTLLSPVAFLQRPLRWLEAISRYQATTSGGPNFAYDLCARRATPDQIASLDLSSWQIAFTGAEPVRSETLDRFATTFAVCGFRREAFYPCYGLAEATLIVSGGAADTQPVVRSLQAAALRKNRVVESSTPENAWTLVSCGQSFPSQQVVVVQPETLIPCATGEVGEIWVAGPSVAQGYWNRPEHTAQTFGARLGDTGEGPFLRTGDLGFLLDGELFVTGRVKDVIIIRGRNHYPQDIELTVERAHPALRPGCGAAFSIDGETTERLVVVQEIERQHRHGNTDAIVRAIRQAVVEQHELQTHAVVLIKPGSIPKTSSGKIQRYLCRSRFLDQTLDAIDTSILEATSPPGADARIDAQALLAAAPDEQPALVETYLQHHLAHVLQVAPTHIDLDQPLSTSGIDSLAAITLQHSLEAQLSVAISMSQLLQAASLRELATQISARLGTASKLPIHESITPGAWLPLSYGQRAIWFLHQLAPERSAYNIACAGRIRSAIKPAALERTLAHLVARHAMLRTTFGVVDGEPRQQVHDELTIAVQHEDASDWSEAEVQAHLTTTAQRPFDLESGPLLRVHLVQRAPQEHVLVLVVHHIIADFWSLAILVRELCELYSAEQNGHAPELAALPVQYQAYVTDQIDRLSGAEGERLWNYWQQQLYAAGTRELPTLDLPTAHARPAVQTYNGARVTRRLTPELTNALKRLSHAHGVTLYTTLLAAFQTVLYRYTGQDDIVIGSPTAGRSRADLVGVVGYFVNPIVLRTTLAGNPTFAALLQQARHTVLTAFEHQEYPFALLAERLQPVRDPSRSPLFQVLFTLQSTPVLNEQNLAAFALGIDGGRIEITGMILESLPFEQQTAQFDLALAMAEIEGQLVGSLQYNTDLFDEPAMTAMLGHLETLLAGAVADPTQRISDLPLLTADERHQLVAGWNATQQPLPRATALHHLIEAQAARTPDTVALIAGTTRLTYAALNAQANQLAHHLRALGVGPDARVAVSLPRTPTLLVALLAVLKAGAAYVPLDPTYPLARRATMLADAQPAVLLTVADLAATLGPMPVATLCLDQAAPQIARQPATNPTAWLAPTQLAYLIYTSGSTGTPKGVMVPHGSVVNFLAAMQQTIGCRAGDTLVAVTSISFDISVLELFWPLTQGACVVLLGEEIEQLPAQMIAHQATLLQGTPALAKLLLTRPDAPQALRGLRALLLGGEALPPALAQQVLPLLTGTLFNMYGPTETTIWSALHPITTAPELSVSIGRPITNTEIYLLDPHGSPVPIGIPGELYIGGEGVTRGYHGHPELTAERFIPDPFGTQPGARLYKTGDLARYRVDGTIEFLGRIDHQIKLRGFRIELGEIETVLGQHSAVREAVVMVRDDANGEQQLVAYVVGEQADKREREPRLENQDLESNGAGLAGHAQNPALVLSSTELRRWVQQYLPEYMTPNIFMLLDALPLTANGKVDRKALPVPESMATATTEAFVAPSTPTEQVVANIWADVLGVAQVGIYDNFFTLGGQSLLAIQVVSRLRETFQVELSPRVLFQSPTIASLAESIEAARKTAQGLQAPPIKPVPRDRPLPLSFGQQQMWVLDRLNPGSTNYNMPIIATRIIGPLNVGVLERSLNALIQRHETLRTHFPAVDGQPVQVIQPTFTLPLPVIDMQDLPLAEREAETVRLAVAEAHTPFDLTHGPLIRATVLRLGPDEHALLLTVHHIISDGWSTGVLIHDLLSLYESFANGTQLHLPPLPIQYADYAAWQRNWLQGGVLEKHLGYWRHKLAGAPDLLKLPTDLPRPAIQRFQGANEPLPLPPTLADELKALSQREGVTLFMTLLAAFNAVLHYYAKSDDIVVGTAIANRNRFETENLIGLFVNELVLRTSLTGDPAFRELLQRVREVTLEAYAHRDLPFDVLVSALKPERQMSYNPLFQVAFVLHNTPMPEVHLPGLTTTPLNIIPDTSQFDLILAITDTAEGLDGWIFYNTDLFVQATVIRMAAHLLLVLGQIVAQPDIQVSTLTQLLADADRDHRLIKQSEYKQAQRQKLKGIRRRAINSSQGDD